MVTIDTSINATPWLALFLIGALIAAVVAAWLRDVHGRTYPGHANNR